MFDQNLHLRFPNTHPLSTAAKNEDSLFELAISLKLPLILHSLNRTLKIRSFVK